MAYVAVAKAVYDYDAQDPETELSFKEDQIVYVIEKEDQDWWKAKLKDDGDAEGQVGLVPANYVEEIPPLNQTRALFAYESTSAEELSMSDESVLHVFSIEEDWLLVRVDGGDEKLGFVPRNYCEPLDASAEVEVADAAESAAEVEAARQAEKERELAERQRQLKLKDKVETWSISEMDGKKKKKGTLGVGNAAVFFASDTDKAAPVKQYPITELATVSQPSSKNLSLSFSSLGQPLEFHCGDSSTAEAILAKLESSKAAAGEALELIEEARSGGVSSGDEHDEPAPTPAPVAAAAAAPRGVRFAAPASAATATVQYDFDADGEDELTVKDGETVTVLDKENDEWWLVKNSSGQEGVVPAAYVQLNDGSAPVQQEESDDEEAREAEAAAARARQAQSAEEERRRIQAAAEARRRQEDEDRELARQIEEEQRQKAQRRAQRRQEEERRQREADAQAARENARSGGLQPPRITKRPSNSDVAAAANRLPTRGHTAPARPPENNRPKPNPQKIRTWSDKSGQFNVEAEYLGLNGNKIRLHKLNGVIIEVPLDKLSSRDAELVRRHEQRKSRPPPVIDDDDVPLGQSTPRRASTAVAPSRSIETQRRAEEPIPPEAMRQPPPRKPRFDWFEFFLSAGCDMDDCTRYASNFDRDRIDESILPELESSTLRSLGLREGDVIRVRKVIQGRFAKKTPEQQTQIDADAEYAKQLQEHENSGSKGPAPQPPPGLFTGPGGKLANNTRRGRPEKKSTGADTVDPSALAAAGDQLSKVSISTPTPPTPPPAAVSPPPAEKKATLIGFDDDAWTIKPSSKPASPAPVQAAPPAPAPPPAPVAPIAQAPAPANTTESLLAQINALRPASTGISQENTGGSGNFDRLSQMVGNSPIQPQQTAQAYGLGIPGSNQPMSQLINQPTGFAPGGQPSPNAPRGPLAPVPSNQGLLNPMLPQQTGMFVPTRASPLSSQPTGFVPQQTGFQQQQMQGGGMMPQPTGYQAGFQQGYGQQPSYQMQPNFTGYPQQQQQQQSAFNTIASIPPPQPQQAPDKFAPSNIFAAMKKTDFGKPEEQQPQASGKYDALRPLTTGYNGAPGMQGMMPQPTGFQPQPQQTGMNGMNGMNGMMPQQTGFVMPPQMTGYNPQMGYMGQQNQNPYGYR